MHVVVSKKKILFNAFKPSKTVSIGEKLLILAWQSKNQRGENESLALTREINDVLLKNSKRDTAAISADNAT